MVLLVAPFLDAAFFPTPLPSFVTVFAGTWNVMENCGIGEDGDIGMVGEREPNAAADGSLKRMFY